MQACANHLIERVSVTEDFRYKKGPVNLPYSITKYNSLSSRYTIRYWPGHEDQYSFNTFQEMHDWAVKHAEWECSEEYLAGILDWGDSFYKLEMKK